MGRYERAGGPASLRSWMSAVSEIVRSVNAAESLGKVLTRVAELACELIGFDFCAVMLADEQRDYLRIAGLQRPHARLPGPGQRGSGATDPAARSRSGHPGRPCFP